MRANATNGMSHICIEFVQMGYYGDESRSLKNVMQHHMEDIMVYFEPKRRSGRVFLLAINV